MDGFVRESETAGGRGCGGFAGVCSPNSPSDVMGYHDAREIPTYRKYAENFTLDDHMFESDASWSLPAHLFEVSEWSPSAPESPAVRRQAHTALARCRASVQARLARERARLSRRVSTNYNYAWTDISYLLHKDGVSWGYFITPGGQPDCDGGNANCSSAPLSVGTPDIWNPLPSFTDVEQDNQIGNIQNVTRLLADAGAGTLPAVSWVVPDQQHSDHPPANIANGQAYVTNLINTVMRRPDWHSTAIFLTWDDWGGF
jgi:phospholipase C